jgi:hypothetical protein
MGEERKIDCKRMRKSGRGGRKETRYLGVEGGETIRKGTWRVEWH